MVHHRVPRWGGRAAEAGRHVLAPPVRAAAGSRAGMSGVLRALVDEIERDRLERREAPPDAPGNVHCFSSTDLARDSACAATKTSIRPLPANSLKLSHRAGA